MIHYAAGKSDKDMNGLITYMYALKYKGSGDLTRLKYNKNVNTRVDLIQGRQPDRGLIAYQTADDFSSYNDSIDYDLILYYDRPLTSIEIACYELLFMGTFSVSHALDNENDNNNDNDNEKEN